jgi:hypothetical protein
MATFITGVALGFVAGFFATIFILGSVFFRPI